MEIEKLIQLPESKILEFKRDLSSLPSILKTIVAFANTAGGTLIVGVSSDGKCTGLGDVLLAEERLANAIADNIRPAIFPEIEIVSLKRKNLLVLNVAHWKGPFYLKKEGVPKGIYIRLGSTSRRASPEIATELQRSALNLSYDQQPLPELTIKDLEVDVSGFKNELKKFDRQKLHGFGCLTAAANRLVPTVGGMILFGKEPQRTECFPDARVSCARFLGTTKSEIIDILHIEGSILQAAHEVPKFIQRNTRYGAEIKKTRRKDIPEYPSVALREALINALAHADYSMIGSHIQISIFDDRLEIQNPGMLPFGLTLENLKAGISRVRNRVIVRVFRQLRLMEEWGSGYRRIIDICRKGGYPEPCWEEIGVTIRVTFYPIDMKQKIKVSSTNSLTSRQQILLKLLTNTLSFKEIHAHFPSISERMLRYDLAMLKKLHLLVQVGKGRATAWKKR